jgi:hypothetical protein
MKNVSRLLVIAALATVFALPAFAQGTTASGTTAATAQDDQAKAELYKKFLDNYKGKPEQQKIAYDSGKEYLSKYSGDTSAENAPIVKFIQNWVTKYEAATRDYDLRQSITKKDYAHAFEVGDTWLSQEPDNLDVMLLLASAAYNNLVLPDAPKNKSLNAGATRIVRHAIELLESGKQPAKWELFPNRDENLSFLYYTLGLITQETSPTDAAAAFTKAAQSNGNYKKDASTYTMLANIYETNELKKLVDAYAASFPPNVPIPDEKKAQYQQMLDQIGRVQDRIIDAYARAAQLLGNDPKYAAAKKAVMAKLTLYYKQRHNDSDAGLDAYVANVLNTPLMLPGQEPAPTPTPSSTSGTDGNAVKPATTTTTQPASSTGAKPASTPATRPATTPQKPPVSKTTPAAKAVAGRTTSGH